MALLERDDQLDAARGYLADAAAGHGRLVYVAGEPGVGKTTFLEHVLEGGEATPLVGWCDGSATPPPLGPLVDMLPDAAGHLWPRAPHGRRCSPGCSRPCASHRARRRTSWSSRTPTGPTRPPWT